MRGPSMVLASAVLLTAGAFGQPTVSPGTEARARAVLREPRWTATAPLPDPFPAPTPAGDALPPPSIQEPFAIGEAMYDGARVHVAVVSLLAKMRIPIVAPAASATAAGGLRLDTDEVHTLIDLFARDLRSAGDLEELPYSFADLHAAVAPLLPQLSVDALAAAYQRAYEARAGDLVPGVMMGRPIEPDMRLTRGQIWMLLMDGFAAPDGETAWGTADRELPDAPSPVPGWSRAEWREAIARLPLLPVRRLLADESTAGSLSFRLSAKAPALASRVTGKTLLTAKAGSLAGQQVTWSVPDAAGLDDIATVSTPLGQPVAIAATGVAQLAYEPLGGASGSGDVVREWRTVTASLPACPLVSSALPVPPPLCGLLIGDRLADFNAQFQWRTTDRLHITIDNGYSLKLGMAGIGTVTRWGEDIAEGTLVRGPKGVYVGVVRATAESTQTVVGSTDCKDGHQKAAQALLVEARTVSPQFGSVMNATKSLELYQWWQPPQTATSGSFATRAPSESYLGLEFFPDGNVTYTAGAEDPCRPHPAASSHRKRYDRSFLPLNDAQWLTAEGNYIVGLHRSADYYYVDYNSAMGAFEVPDGNGDKYSPFWIVRVRRPSLAKP